MKKKILIVDDSVMISDLISEFLSAHYDVQVDHNVMNAFERLQKGYIPDMILSDVQMPDIDGEEFLGNLKSSNIFKDIPVIMLSQLDNSDFRIKLLKAGAEDYLVKPFNPEELQIRIEKILSN